MTGSGGVNNTVNIIIVGIILRRIYQDRVISKNLKERTLKKFFLDNCTKTAFSFNNKFYQQKYCVSMGSFLGPVLANTIMAELEDVFMVQLLMVQLSFILALLMTLYW